MIFFQTYFNSSSHWSSVVFVTVPFSSIVPQNTFLRVNFSQDNCRHHHHHHHQPCLKAHHIAALAWALAPLGGVPGELTRRRRILTFLKHRFFGKNKIFFITSSVGGFLSSSWSHRSSSPSATCTFLVVFCFSFSLSTCWPVPSEQMACLELWVRPQTPSQLLSAEILGVS